MTAEPCKPTPRRRHVLRWIVLGMALFIFAGAFVVFKWGDAEKMPGFAKVWKLRGDLLVKQIRSGRDKPETQQAGRKLAFELLTQGSYRAAENQFRLILASELRVYGTNMPGLAYYHIWVADCLFLQGKKKEATALMLPVLQGYLSPRRGQAELIEPALYWVTSRLHSLGRRQEALALAKFVLEQGRELHKDDPAMLLEWEKYSQDALQALANPPPPLPTEW